MKVIGGKDIPGSNGLIGAYVARIYPGGVVETLGEVKEGDQVVEWNGIPLTGKTYEEVQRVIASSGDEVEIVIRSDFNMLDPYASFQQRGRSPRLGQDRGGAGTGHGTVRSSRDDSRTGNSNQRYGSPSRGRESSHGTSRRGNPSPYDSDRPNHEYNSSNRNLNPTSRVEGLSTNTGYGANQHPPPNNPSWTTSHPPNSKTDNLNDSNKSKYRAEHITGEIQLQICYDARAAILYVTIVRSRELVTTRDNSGLPDPFVKCYLLPGRCMENQRRTRYFSRCSNPEWKQTMVYPDVPQDSLKKKQLEISVWNYDIYRPNEFLGEVTLDLSVDSIIDEQARWYKLHDHHRTGSGPNPSSSLGQISDVSNGSGRKMARLNNPANNEELRKAVSNQAHRLSLFPSNNMSTHPLVAQGCHAAVCSIL